MIAPLSGLEFPAAARARFADAIEAALDCGDVDTAAHLIDLLDLADGDTDLEPCEAGDDGCHYFLCGGREGWGYGSYAQGAVPEYGDDQSEGPLASWTGRSYSGWHSLPWGA